MFIHYKTYNTISDAIEALRLNVKRIGCEYCIITPYVQFYRQGDNITLLDPDGQCDILRMSVDEFRQVVVEHGMIDTHEEVPPSGNAYLRYLSKRFHCRATFTDNLNGFMALCGYLMTHPHALQTPDALFFHSCGIVRSQRGVIGVYAYDNLIDRDHHGEDSIVHLLPQKRSAIRRLTH